MNTTTNSLTEAPSVKNQNPPLNLSRKDINSLIVHQTEFDKYLNSTNVADFKNLGDITTDNFFDNELVEVTKSQFESYISSLTLTQLIGFQELIRCMNDDMIIEIDGFAIGETINLTICMEEYGFEVLQSETFVRELVFGYIDCRFQVHVDILGLLDNFLKY